MAIKVNEETTSGVQSVETEQASLVSSPEVESRPLFGKYGRIDNLARAITHGEYAVNKDLRQMYSQDYRSILRAMEGLVSEGITEERARLKKLLRGIACTCGHLCPSRSEWQHGATCVHQDWCALSPDIQSPVSLEERTNARQETLPQSGEL